jgi:hypothetical protein
MESTKLIAMILGVTLVIATATVYTQSVLAFVCTDVGCTGGTGGGSTGGTGGTGGAGGGLGVIGGGQGNNGPGTIGGGVGDVCLSCFVGGTNGGQTGESIHAAINSDISALRAGIASDISTLRGDLGHVGSGPTGAATGNTGSGTNN